MKNLTLLLLFAVLAISCGDDIESNTPSIQGEVNGQFFRSDASSATLNMDGSVTLRGDTGVDEITLKTSEITIGEYVLGDGSVNEAAYTIGGSLTYATGTTGDGIIEITRNANNTVSGEFFFNAINGDTINVNKGSFFDVPLVNPIGTGNANCAELAIATNNAAANFGEASEDDENYDALCMTYRDALQEQIDNCEDTLGALQATIDSLPCSEEEEEETVQGTITVTAGTLPITFDEITVVTENNLVKISGETSAPNDYSISFNVAQNIDGEDVFEDFEITITSTFFPSTQGGQFTFNNEVTTNQTGEISGTFNGYIENADGGDAELTNGMFDLTY
jgi:hypothetical protein